MRNTSIVPPPLAHIVIKDNAGLRPPIINNHLTKREGTTNMQAKQKKEAVMAKSIKAVKAAKTVKAPRKAKNKDDVDRVFEMTTEELPEKWKDKLEVFFEESEAGIHDHWHLKSEEVGSIDVYHTFGRYDITNLVEGNIKVFLKGRAVKVRGQETKVFKIEEGYILSPAVYENASCFRYALPTEGESA